MPGRDPSRRRGVRALCALLPLMVVHLACAGTSAPDGFLPEPEDAGQEGFGAWIEVERVGQPRVEGEFIAVDDETVYVLDAKGALIDIPRAQVTKAKLATYESQADLIGGWATLGTLSTLSHGFILIISAPVWIVAGGLTARAVSEEPLEHAPWQDWAKLRRFARFPQGLPPGAVPAPKSLPPRGH